MTDPSEPPRHYGRPIRHYLAELSMIFIVGLIALRLMSVASGFPYYFVWDMDLVLAEDCIMLHSGLIPDHLVHPGFGAFLLLYCTQSISYAMGGLSMLSLSDLAASLNPLVVVAESTDFIRAHSPFIALGTAVLLWASLVILFRPKLHWRLLSLGVLGVQESLLFHATMARSDIYAMFFWSVAVLFVTLSACYSRRFRNSAALLFCAGVAVGLCFLTKMQSLFYVFSVPFLFAFALSLRDEQSPEIRGTLLKTASAAKAICALSLLGTVAFVLLVIGALNTPMRRGMSMWENEFRLNALGIVFFLALAGLTVWQGIQVRRGRHATRGFALSAGWTILSTGFLASFLLHFALLLDLDDALRYMLLDAKMLFGSTEQNPIAHSTSALLVVAKDSVRYAPLTFAVHGGALLLLVFAIVRRKMLPSSTLVVVAVLSSLATLAVVPGTRYMLRDLLWLETLFNFLTLAYLLTVVTRPNATRSFASVAALGLALVLLGVNGLHNARMPARIDANTNNYGWQDEPWLKNMFTHNQLAYGKIMDERYESGRDVAKRQATRHKAIRRAVSYVFHNQGITHRNIGTLSEGYPAWTEDLAWRFTAFPESLREAIVIDNASLELRDTFLFDESKVQGTSNNVDKFVRASDTRSLGMLARPDLRVMLFVHADDIAGLVEEKLVETGEQITVSKGAETRTLHGLEVWSYMAIPTDGLSDPYFSVIQFRDPPLYFPYTPW